MVDTVDHKNFIYPLMVSYKLSRSIKTEKRQMCTREGKKKINLKYEVLPSTSQQKAQAAKKAPLGIS
jgi:hypothetical protein